jgi:N-acyl-D-amino-acid deacylase
VSARQPGRAPRFVVIAVLLTATAWAQEPFDVIIAGGNVVDGTGNPWYVADVGLRNGDIVAIGDLSEARATINVDARGRVVAPGFVDLHSHADAGRVSLADPNAAAASNLVTQGITTVVVGQDGRCQCPVGERAELYRSQGIGPNVVQLVGHGTIRAQVLGGEPRQATAEEISDMADLVRLAMSEGAAGMSSGLEYNPGRYSVTDEVTELAKVVADFGGFYISHERSEGRTPMWWLPSMGGEPPDLIDAVLETIRIGEATGMPVVASHIKVKGADYWGTAPTVTRLIQEARDRGVQIYADQYPYTTTGSDGNTVLIPSWALGAEERPDPQPRGREQRDFASRREAFRRRLAEADTERQIRTDIAHEISRRGGADNLLILDSHNPEFVGLSLADAAQRQNMAVVDLAVMLQLEGLDRPGGARIRGFSLDERDVEHYMQQEFTATSTDAGIAMEGSGFPHPRFYGTYPRKLRRYVLEGLVITMAHAVRSSTSLPAQIAGLARRGQLREGYAADIVVIHTAEVGDHSTAMDPHRYSTGIDAVLINGEFAVRDGQPTGALDGRVLEGDEFVRRRLGSPRGQSPALVAPPQPAAPAR